jgi:hypothetical protein
MAAKKRKLRKLTGCRSAISDPAQNYFPLNTSGQRPALHLGNFSVP